jgi:hypothetical protein
LIMTLWDEVRIIVDREHLRTGTPQPLHTAAQVGEAHVRYWALTSKGWKRDLIQIRAGQELLDIRRVRGRHRDADAGSNGAGLPGEQVRKADFPLESSPCKHLLLTVLRGPAGASVKACLSHLRGDLKSQRLRLLSSWGNARRC